MAIKRVHHTALAAVISGAACANHAPAVSVQGATAENPAHPNIVLILADDLGYGDLGIHGVQDMETPHIDALFRGGMRFEEAYVTHPTCGPSRAALLTGRHHMRIGFRRNPDHVIPAEPGNLMGLPRDELTLGDLLRNEGYATALIGKWHLGRQKAAHPLNRGFDEYYGFLGSLYRYFDLGNLPLPYSIMRGFEREHEKEYLTHAFAREGIDFIERHKDRPFFLFLSHLAVHTPLMYDDDPNARVSLAGTGDVEENRRMLVNMTENLDRSVGEIMQKLNELGLDETTLVFFLSDNGGPEVTGAYSNKPLRGWKGSVFEGGLRVPLAVRWPGQIEPGSKYEYPISAMDIVATAIHLAGGELPSDREYDSRNLVPVLTGEKQDRLHDRPFFWESLGGRAVRRGDWKLVLREDQVEGLYHIPQDPGEQNDLAAKHPERVSALKELYDRWEESCPPWHFTPIGREAFVEWEEEHGAIADEWRE